MKFRMLGVVVFSLIAASVVLADNLIVGSGSSDPGRFAFDRLADNGSLVLSGTLDVARSSHTAVKLSSSSVFLAGGVEDPTSIEILDESGNVLYSNLLQDQRISAAGVLLSNSNVFICAGTAAPQTWEDSHPYRSPRLDRESVRLQGNGCKYSSTLKQRRLDLGRCCFSGHLGNSQCERDSGQSRQSAGTAIRRETDRPDRWKPDVYRRDR